MNPNSQNQLWSRWTFTVFEAGRFVKRADVESNAARWLRRGFGSVGTVLIKAPVQGCWVIEALIEGVPAHDPGYVANVQLQFKGFVEQGWGLLAVGTVGVKVVAGSEQDGRPSPQMVVMPSIISGG